MSVQSAASAVEFRACSAGMVASSSGLQGLRRGAVRLVLGQRRGDQAEGVPGLAVGELVRAGVPGGGDAQPHLAGFGQAGEGGVHAGQVRGPAVVQGEVHARQ
jgi:hypothetical protein